MAKHWSGGLAILFKLESDTQRFVLAIGSVLAATGMRLVFDPWLGREIPYGLFVLAIATTALYAGGRQAILATVLSALSSTWFFIEPRYSLCVYNRESFAGLVLFLFIGVVISQIGHRMQRGRRAAEAAEQDWKRTFDSSSDLICILDSDFRITRANRAMAAKLERDRESFFGEKCFECMHGAADAPRECPHFCSVLDGKEHTAEVREFGSDYLVTCTPLRDDQGKFIGTMHVARDITERKQAEAAIRESEVRLKRNQEMAHLGSWEFDLRSNQLTWSDEVYRIFGFAPQEFEPTNEAFFDAVPPDDRDLVDAAYSESLRENRNEFELEHRVIQRDTGSVRYVHEKCEHLRDSTGNIIRSFGMVHDITERKLAEAALKESQERLRLTFDRVGVGILEVEEEDRFINANDRACEILGYSRDELLKTKVHELTYPDDRALSDRMNAQVHSGSCDHLAYEKRYQRKDGSALWVHVTVSAIRDESGRWKRSIGTFEDISERKQVEEALKEADRRKDEFLAMLAHELRNPMSTISAAASLLGRMNLSGQAEIARQALDRQTRHLSKLVDDLLDVSRITRGKIKLEKEDVDLRESIERAAEMAKGEIQSGKHVLKLVLPDEPLPVRGDVFRLQQILVNLLSNAARYMDECGEIEIRACSVGDTAVIKVRDTGAGIDEADRKRIFEPFVQVNPGLSRGKGGLGIGLTIVKQLVELHGGTVGVNSEGRGKGSTFTVCLPLQNVPKISEKERRIVATRPGLHVLVVDDNSDSAVLTAALLEDAGHEAIVAFDGESGLRKAIETVPDVILLDIGLPGMSGYEVARELRASGLQAPLIVAVTGYGQESDRARSREAGFDYHLVKPLKYESIFDIFSDWQATGRAKEAHALRQQRSPDRWQ